MAKVKPVNQVICCIENEMSVCNIKLVLSMYAL